MATELVGLREAAGMTQAQLAKEARVSQSGITRLETGRTRPNVGDVIKILEMLPGIDSDRWGEVVRITHEAAQRGWWEAEEIDIRQARYADLEAGAAVIQEYQQPFVPGLLQTPEYTRARAEHSPPLGGGRFEPEALIRARSGRQRMLRRPGGPNYEVIVDELAIRRPTAPPKILAGQLRHLVNLGDDRITIRVLPVDSTIEEFNVPQSAFSLYSYPDSRDPMVVAVDTVTSDLTLATPAETEPYRTLYDRLRSAALSPTDSAALLTQAAIKMEGAS